MFRATKTIGEAEVPDPLFIMLATTDWTPEQQGHMLEALMEARELSRHACTADACTAQHDLHRNWMLHLNATCSLTGREGSAAAGGACWVR